MQIKTSSGVHYVNANYVVEEKQGEYPKLTCTIAKKDNHWLDEVQELDRVYTEGEQDEFVIVNPVKITKGDSYDLEISAVGAFHFEFVKSYMYNELKTATYHIDYLLGKLFEGSRFVLELNGTFPTVEFEGFGKDDKLTLFERVMSRFGAEYKIVGKVVQVNNKIGNDTGFQFRYLKNIKDTEYSIDASEIATYAKGLGAWKDEEDHSKGRLEIEYKSSLYDIFGHLDYGTVEDERMYYADTLKAKCKSVLDATVSVTLKTTLVALQRQSYKAEAHIGDFIWFIDERIQLEKKIRFAQIKTTYLSDDSILKQEVVLGDKDAYSKQKDNETQSSAVVKQTSNQLSELAQKVDKTHVLAQNGVKIYFSDVMPVDEPKGTIRKGDKLYLDKNGKVLMYYWNGVQWELEPVVNDVEKFKQEIAKDFEEVDAQLAAQSDAHNQAVAEILAQATSAEDLAAEAKLIGEQAVADAASAITTALQSKDEAIADATAQVATVSQALNTAKTDLQNQVNTIDAKAQTLTADLANSKNDILAQANAQTALDSRVTTVETTANGTKETVTQLSKTVNDLSGEVTSATQSIKTVEDSIDGVYTTLSKIQVGGGNLVAKSQLQKGYIDATGNLVVTDTHWTTPQFPVAPNITVTVPNGYIRVIEYDANKTFIRRTVSEQYYNEKTSITYTFAEPTAFVAFSFDDEYANPFKIEYGAQATPWAPSVLDASVEFAEYKQSIDGQLTSLSQSYQTLSGQVSQNKTTIETTADGIREDVTSLQSYVDDEGTRRTEYLTMSELKTAELIAAERTKVARDYVAKSTYDENVRGTTLKLNEIKTTADTTKQNLATYQDTVDSKLTELTSSTQTLDGKINTASAKVDTVAGQIRTEISTVEAKIQKSIGGRNLAQKTSSDWSTPYTNFSGTANTIFYLYKVLADDLAIGDTLKTRIVLKYTNIVQASGQTAKISLNGSGNVTGWGAGWYNASPTKTISGSGEVVFEHEFIITSDHLKNQFWDLHFRTDYISSGSLQWKLAKVEKSNVFTGWSPAPEDFINELSSVKTTISQTASGVEQLSTSLSTTNNKVTTAETKINQLIGDVSSKVSQTDYNTLSGRVNSAETAITQNATDISKRLTSTQVEQAITNKGYATVAVLENKVKETADSFSRTISETKALIPTSVGGTNLLLNGQFKDGLNGWSKNYESIGTFDTDNDSSANMQQSGLHFFGNESLVSWFGVQQSVRVNLNKGDRVTVSVSATSDGAESGLNVGVHFKQNGEILANSWKIFSRSEMIYRKYKRFYLTFTVPNHVEYIDQLNFMFYGENGKTCNLYITDVKAAVSPIGSDYSPAISELTTVTAFNKVSETVDEYKRLISSGGSLSNAIQSATKFEQSIASGGDIYQAIQTAKGLATTVSGTNGLSTQVSTLAGSYAIKNLTNSGTVLNQLNLNKDGSVKIDGSLVRITGKTVIDNAVIKSAMIADGQIGTAQIGTIDGATANIININAKNISADGLSGNIVKGGTLRSTNSATNFDLVNGKLNFDTDTASVRRVTSGIPTQFVKFLKSSNGALTVIGSNRDGSESADNDSFAGIKIYSSSTKEVSEIISDQIYFLTGANNRRGWQMSTITGSDNKQISLFPTGDPTKSLIYASDYYIKRNGKNIALIDFITYVNACLKHLQNYTGRTDIWNGFDI